MNGNTYEGEWINFKPDGFGIMTFADDGSIYEGQFKDGQRHGKGKQKAEGIAEYQGEWVNNNFEGKGVLVYADGGKYEGDFFKNKKEGYGT